MPLMTLKGKRGHYILARANQHFATHQNKERARGIQYFMDANPECAFGMELFKALENLQESIYPTKKPLGPNEMTQLRGEAIHEALDIIRRVREVKNAND